MHLKSKESALSELQSALEADEQKLEMLQDEIEKIEQEKSQLSQDKETCKQKLDRGIKLLGTFSLKLSYDHTMIYSIRCRYENKNNIRFLIYI